MIEFKYIWSSTILSCCEANPLSNLRLLIKIFLWAFTINIFNIFSFKVIKKTIPTIVNQESETFFPFFKF